MKKFVFMSLLASWCISSFLTALTPGKPIEGFPNMIAKEYHFGAGQSLFTLKLPAGWGIGEFQVSKTGHSYFNLFPQNGGYGCAIEMRWFESDGLAKEELEKIRKKTKNANSFENGFELKLKNGWYLCKTNNDYLIQISYSLPKKNKNSSQIWEELKQSIVVSSIKEDPMLPKPAVEKTFTNWICHHPENKVELFFQPKLMMSATKNEDPNQIYLT